MIEKINNHLQKIGSNFRTEDGFTICMYIGNLTFLKRTFKTQVAREIIKHGKTA